MNHTTEMSWGAEAPAFVIGSSSQAPGYVRTKLRKANSGHPLSVILRSLESSFSVILRLLESQKNVIRGSAVFAENTEKRDSWVCCVC